ncbi:MAG TPA: DUF4142 domain-containing protein [Lysobacter sp.]|nr:DUF4142 domain-containing protein [Lysobacter sp.]
MQTDRTPRAHLLAIALACALAGCQTDNAANTGDTADTADTASTAGTRTGGADASPEAVASQHDAHTAATAGAASPPTVDGPPREGGTQTVEQSAARAATAHTGTGMADTGATADAAPTAPVTDEQFYQLALAGGSAEVKAAQLALQKSKHDGIRQFATMLERDHANTNRRFAEASGKPATVPPEPQAQRAMQQLAQQDGAAFDRAWLAQMDKDHAKTIALFENAARSNRTSQKTKQLAQSTLPALRQHAEAVRRLMGQLDAR